MALGVFHAMCYANVLLWDRPLPPWPLSADILVVAGSMVDDVFVMKGVCHEGAHTHSVASPWNFFLSLSLFLDGVSPYIFVAVVSGTDQCHSHCFILPYSVGSSQRIFGVLLCLNLLLCI